MKKTDKPRKAKAARAASNAARNHAAESDAAEWRWADPAALVVDPELRRLVPLQSRGEVRALGASLKSEGCRDPLLVWKGRDVVLDGHTRRDLCMYLKQKVKVRDVELADERAAVEYVLEIQRQRRNLTREAMSYFRGAEYNAVKEQRGGQKRGPKRVGQRVPPVSTAYKVA